MEGPIAEVLPQLTDIGLQISHVRSDVCHIRFQSRQPNVGTVGVKYCIIGVPVRRPQSDVMSDALADE